ncbi:MAG: TRAM domain-containing protein [Actinomycetota bacterium]|jgi:tRNA/tmRNA/rRNA uracil-C5-methylase (TrmA/RlmC/RlmD family)|nr:class I SAM-dependent RNA methyltransferase [Euzebyales bacterium]MDQ3452374.1 TRAM domain-containing protein [Actinomycetota bacterium]
METVRLTGMAHGGDAVGHLSDGRAVFVGFAIPGEVVHVEVTTDKPRWARARLLEVLEPSADRVAPPCPYYGTCGGCRLQHIAGQRQAQLVGQVVAEQLQRLGGVDNPVVAETVRPADYGYRSRARFAVDRAGRLGFRKAASHDIVAVERCLLLDEATQTAREAAGDRWTGATEVEVRSGVRGAAAIVDVVAKPRGRPALPPGELAVTRRGGGPPLRGDPVVTESVAGMDFRVSPGSFFQANRAGAEALVALVCRAVAAGDRVLDLYAGVGLFARALAAKGAEVTAVEAGAAAATDARHNLRDLPPSSAAVGQDLSSSAAVGSGPARVVRAPVERYLAEAAANGTQADVVVLDPPRRGAGTAVVADLVRVARGTIVYVACDPAALARDARALLAAGWRLTEAVPVDQFAQTAQIEVVATFTPAR